MPRPDTNRWLPLLQQGRWFASLSEKDQRALLAQARPRSLAAGERLFARGDPCDGLFALLDGSVHLGAVDAAGREQMLGVLEPPAWFGEIAVFDGGPRTHDAMARTAAALLQVPDAAWQALAKEDPLWWRRLGQLLAEKTRALFVGLEDLAALPAPQRVARRLLALADGHGMRAPGHARREVPVSQAQLGAMLSLTRQTVSEVLGGFEARGWVRRGYGRIVLQDAAALAALGAATPPE